MGLIFCETWVLETISVKKKIWRKSIEIRNIGSPCCSQLLQHTWRQSSSRGGSFPSWLWRSPRPSSRKSHLPIKKIKKVFPWKKDNMLGWNKSLNLITITFDFFALRNFQHFWYPRPSSLKSYLPTKKIKDWECCSIQT